MQIQLLSLPVVIEITIPAGGHRKKMLLFNFSNNHNANKNTLPLVLVRCCLFSLPINLTLTQRQIQTGTKVLSLLAEYENHRKKIIFGRV